MNEIGSFISEERNCLSIRVTLCIKQKNMQHAVNTAFIILMRAFIAISGKQNG